MATINRESNIGKLAVDASCEIVIDALYMTTDVLHSITNKLPVPMEGAQLVLREEKEAMRQTVAIAVPRRRASRWILGAIGLVAMTLGALQVARAVDSAHAAKAPTVEAGITLPTPGEVAREHLNNGSHQEALHAIELAAAQGMVDADVRATRVEALLALGQLDEARAHALEGVADGLGPRFVTLYRQSLEQDPRLNATARPLSEAELGAVKSRKGTLKLETGGVVRTLTIAETDDNRWAAQVSSARLCVVLNCAFDVPAAEHVLVDRAGAERLGLDTEILAWRTEDGRDVVDAALTEQIDAPARFPIEVTRSWRNLLSAQVDADVLDAPFAATIKPVAERGDWAAGLMRQRGEAGTRDLGRQVADVIVVDFLTNNYRRFQRRKARYGKYTGWIGGSIVSTDQSHAFAERDSRRVRDRFQWVTRMSGETAAAVRLMAPEFIDEQVLVGLNDRQREVFWGQQESARERLAELETEFGSSQAFAL